MNKLSIRYNHVYLQYIDLSPTLIKYSILSDISKNNKKNQKPVQIKKRGNSDASNFEENFITMVRSK